MPTYYCLNCGYNLTGLCELRCPECGARFTRAELYKARSKADRALRRIWGEAIAFPLFVIGLVPLWLFVVGNLAQIHGGLAILGSWGFVLITFPLLLIGFGGFLARRYRKALAVDQSSRSGRPVRPLWVYWLLFTVILTVLMGVYLFLVSLYFIVPKWLARTVF